jgi:hypothetical protein
MESILKACTPRSDLISGTFNPEIFTASLSQVMDYYRGKPNPTASVYTEAEQLFGEATYPTDGLKMVVSEVFSRLAGDNTVPAIHRLETAFGGGKTHALIACAHIGFKGAELASVTTNLIANELLPKPGEVAVVGISGDEIPVHKPKGSKLIPYTLWGEIAFQVGGKELYKDVEAEATSRAAPGKTYFDAVFGGKKVLLMLDELAQYAARLSAAHAAGGDQLAAFLMALHGYARSNAGISVILTLASSADAFGNQTEQLTRLLSAVVAKSVSKDEAMGIGQQAIDGVASIVARDATGVVPVQAAEISRVLAKRLFDRIDSSVAQKTALAYEVLYRKNSSLLPDEASRADYKERLAAHYPFHPTLIDFLNNKLASYENFQGTRGVLRVLALAVRNLWQKRVEIPMIHTCHLDLRDARTVNELIGRTGSGELLPVLNADVGGADTESIEGGRSNAEEADQRNPHPEGWPMYEYTWKTVFLHSLVGREDEQGSNIFGLTEQDALFQVAFPGLTPPQVAEALKEIGRSAFYLRCKDGRYYASLDPSVNIALAKIRRRLTLPEVNHLLDATARKVVIADIRTFHVVHDVALPEHIPDNKGKPVLALVGLNAEEVDIEEFVTTAGPNKARVEQNLIIVLVPDTVKASLGSTGQQSLLDTFVSRTQDGRKYLHDLARTVLAMQRLNEKPQDYGINPVRLEEDDFKQRFRERPKALETAVTESYKSLWYPSASGQIVCREIRTAGGEGGVSVLEQIRKTLLDDGELVTVEHDTPADLTNLRKLFFERTDVVAISKVRQDFNQVRRWPILEAPSVLDQLIRAGVTRGVWCLFRMGGEESTKPDEFYSRETGELPFNLDFSLDYAIITPEGARKRYWTESSGPGLSRTKDWVREVSHEMQATTLSEIVEAVAGKFGEVPSQAINEAVNNLVQEERIMVFKGKVDQDEKPDLIGGSSAVFYNPEPDDVIITPAKAAEKGWITEKARRFSLAGKEGAKTLLPLLRRIGSLFQKGGKSRIDCLDLTEMVLPKGGKLRIAVTDTPAESVKDLGELFEVAAGLVQTGEDTEAYLDIDEPEDDCPFIQELRKQMKQ